MRILVFSLPLWVLSTSLVFAADSPKWDQLFKPWEKSCSTSPELSKFLDNLAVQSKDGKYVSIGKIVLPDSYRTAVGGVMVKYYPAFTGGSNTSAVIISVPVLSGTYYGIPVSSVEFDIGENMNMYSLHFKQNINAVKNTLKLQKVELKKSHDTDTGADTQAVLHDDKGSSYLNCDNSPT